MKRILAIDYGERRTGVAVSDELGITAQGLNTIVVKDQSLIPAKIADIVAERDIGTIVIGLPLNMNGTESEKSEKVRQFGTGLAEMTGCTIVYWDERMTSLQAQRVLQELSVKTRNNKEHVDRIAATLILQEYLTARP